MNVDRLESLIPDDISLKVKPDRVFYLGMDFNLIENYRFNDPDFYPLQHMMHKEGGGGHAHHMFSPQINNGEGLMNMNNGDNEMPSAMESLTTLSNSDLEQMLANSEHQMRCMNQAETNIQVT